MRDANIRRNMLLNYATISPIPISSNLKSGWIKVTTGFLSFIHSANQSKSLVKSIHMSCTHRRREDID